MGLDAVDVLGAGLVGTIRNTRKAAKERRRAAAIARRRERLQTVKANIANIEEYRQQVGQVINISAQTGGLDGSGALGAQFSLLSQAASNITFNEQLQSFAEAESRRLSRAADFDLKAQISSQLTQAATSFI